MKLRIFFLLSIYSVIANGQHKLSGFVKSENRVAIPHATVTAKQKQETLSTVSDASGYYEFTNLAAGSCGLTVTSVGFEDGHEMVAINKTETTLDVILITAVLELQTVEVTGRAAKNYTSDYSFSATKSAIAIKDIPQSVQSVTKELINDRQAFQLADAVKVVSGVIPVSYYNQFAIRGVSQNEEGQIINGLRTRQHYFLQPLTGHIERVEVIKGPASATFSSVDPGGSINMVTKKPLAVSRKQISLTSGSFNTIRGALDFTGPLNEDKTLLYRINGAYQEANSFRDLVRNNAILFSPSFSYIPNEKTALNAELIYSDMYGTLDRGQPVFGSVNGITNLNSTPISLSLGASNDFFKSKELILTNSLTRKLSKSIAFNALYMKQTWSEDLQEHRSGNAFAQDTDGTMIPTLATAQFLQRKQFWNIDNINAYFNFDFKTGETSHQLVAGYDLHSWEKTKGGGQNAARGFFLKNGAVANSFVKAKAKDYQLITIDGKVLPKPNLHYVDLSNPQYTIRNINEYTLNSRTAVPAALTTTHSIYIQEVLRWKKFIVLLSLRHEWFKDIVNYRSPGEASFTNVKFLPRIGVTYELTRHINVYATYLEGFQPQSNSSSLMPNTSSFFQSSKSAALFKPLMSELKEIGGKIDLLKGKVRITSAIYEINQKNLLQNADLPAYPDSLTTRGGERSRGFEIDAAGFLLSNWQINASYSYIDSKIVEDRDPTLINTRKQNTPVNSANVWTRYNFAENSKLKDLGIGLGLQYNGDKVPWFTRAFNVPAYTVVDMALYFNPSKTNLQLALNVNNVFNQTYWLSAQSYWRLFPGAPRSMMFTATYKF